MIEIYSRMQAYQDQSIFNGLTNEVQIGVKDVKLVLLFNIWIYVGSIKTAVLPEGGRNQKIKYELLKYVVSSTKSDLSSGGGRGRTMRLTATSSI